MDFLFERACMEAQPKEFNSRKTYEQALGGTNSLKGLRNAENYEDPESPETSNTNNGIPDLESSNESLSKAQGRNPVSQSSDSKQEEIVDEHAKRKKLSEEAASSESKMLSEHSNSNESVRDLLLNNREDSNEPAVGSTHLNTDAHKRNQNPASLERVDLQPINQDTEHGVKDKIKHIQVNKSHFQCEHQKGTKVHEKCQNNQGWVKWDEAEYEARQLEPDTLSVETRKQEYELRDYQREQIANVKKLKEHSSHYCSTYFSHRPLGLMNIGNSCYQNAILQNFLNMALLAQHFLFEEKSGKLSCLYKDLLICQRDNSRNYEKILSILHSIENITYRKNTSLKPPEQQDAIEFMKIFLEILNDENTKIEKKPSYKQLCTSIPNDENFKRNLQEKSHEWYEFGLKREKSVVTDLLEGQILNMTECKNCKTRKTSFDRYWDLTLGFNPTKTSNKPYSLMEMLQNFLKKETISGNDVYCETCQTNCSSTYSSSIYKLPEILVIDFKRFKQEEDQWKKIDDRITFPINRLDLSELIKDSDDISVKDPVYTLFGIVSHHGTLTNGHYTTECMNYMTGKWNHFNDEYVRKSQIEEFARKNVDCYFSPSILFYIKSSHVPHLEAPNKNKVEAVDDARPELEWIWGCIPKPAWFTQFCDWLFGREVHRNVEKETLLA